MAVLLWWLFFCRAPQVDRWGAIVLMTVRSVATPPVIDKSIATGAMEFLFVIYAIPVLSLGLVGGVVASRRQARGLCLPTGSPRRFGPDGGDSYSSPHLVTIDGVTQIVLMSALGATSVAPAEGKLLWKYSWPSDTRIMQAAVTADGDLLITAGDAMGGVGMRRIAVAREPAGWITEERWTSAELKPSFNDSVVHNGRVFGFNGSILASIGLQDGKRMWKGGHYGSGQLLLLADQDLLLVVSEEGGLALVKQPPTSSASLRTSRLWRARRGITPVLAGDRLLARNGNEMAAFGLALAVG